MINHSTYIPILKWKQGEYQALSELTPEIKKNIVPLFEIPPIGFDFENRKQSKTIDEHIQHLGSRLKKKWGSAQCLIDVTPLILQDSEHIAYIPKIFELYRSESCEVTPVITLDAKEETIEAIKQIAHLDKRGICLRLKSSFIADGINENIASFLSKIELHKSNVDLLVDFEDLPFSGQFEQFFDFLISNLKTLKEINLWRSFAICGGSFPKNADQNNAKRLEWLLYKKCYNSFVDSYRLPAFGDYNINSKEFVELDMRLVKPYAKLRYTLNENWYIDRGTAVRGRDSRGFGQFRGMCQKLIETPYYRGKEFSNGDKYIYDCANGTENTGNLSTWVKVSVNQHLTKVVHDLANLYGFSI